MGGWIEQLAGRKWVSPLYLGASQRVFLEVASGTADVPAKEDTWPAGGDFTVSPEWSEVLRHTVEYVDGNENRRRVTAHYGPPSSNVLQSRRASPNPPPREATPTQTFNDLPRRMDMGLTTEQIDDGTRAYWTGTTTPVGKPRYKRIPTTTMRYSKIYTSWSALLGAVLPKIGKVSQSEFDNSGSDEVLFAGCSAGEFRNEGGTINIIAEFTMEIRKVPVGAGFGGWNYLYNEDAGAWQKATPLLYATADLSALFPAP